MSADEGESAKPRPRISPDNAPFWEACRRHELVLPFCGDCGKPHLPPGPVCPHCFSDRISWRKASGRGRISTFVVVHKAWFPAFAGDIPYTVAQVELEEGPRLTASIADAPDRKVAVGQEVEVVFDDIDREFTLPRFRRIQT